MTRRSRPTDMKLHAGGSSDANSAFADSRSEWPPKSIQQWDPGEQLSCASAESDVQQIEQEFIVEHRRLAAAALQVDLDGLGGYSLRHQTLSQSCLEGLPDLEKPPRQRWEEPCAGVRRRQLEHRQRSLPLRLAAGLRSFTLRKRSRTASRRQSSAFSRQQIPYATQNGPCEGDRHCGVWISVTVAFFPNY